MKILSLTLPRRLIHWGLTPALALVLAGSTLAPTPAFGQAGKEPTDGFFDVPARESAPSWGLPAYLVTCFLGGVAIFILCKSARRG